MDTIDFHPAVKAGFAAAHDAGLAGLPWYEASDRADAIMDDAGVKHWDEHLEAARLAHFENGVRERAIDLHTKDQAPYRAALIFEELPADAGRAQFVAKLRGEFPALGPNRAESIVDRIIRSRGMRRPPQCSQHPTDPFATLPDTTRDAELKQERKRALKMYIEARAQRHCASKIPTPSGQPAKSVAGEINSMIGRLQELAPERSGEAQTSLRRVAIGMERNEPIEAAPVDLWQRYEAPPLPRGVLPAVIEDFAFGHATAMGADPAGLGMAALCVAGAAISDTIALRVKQHDDGWRENGRLWVGLVGMPSTKKTPIMSAAMRPIRRLDNALAVRNAELTARYHALPKAEQAKTPEPAQPRYLVEDSTVEASQQVLAHSPHGILSIQDELSGWFGQMDKYSPGKGAAADRSFHLKSFNGMPYSVNRVGRGSILIPNLSIALLGGIQPEPMRKIAGDSVDDGLIQRFLPIMLRPATIGRDEPAGDCVAKYERLVERLAALAPPTAGNLDAGRTLQFNPEARMVRERLEAEHVDLAVALETVSPKLAAHIGKMDGYFARLCLIWHCIEHSDGELPLEVGVDVAERVARFMVEFLRPNAVAFYSGTLGVSAGHEDLMALASIIVSDSLSEVSARDVQRSSRAMRHVTADDARRLCEKLESFGWLVRMEAAGRGTAPRWRVVTEVHTVFAERGRLEAERRAKAKADIAAALGT